MKKILLFVFISSIPAAAVKAQDNMRTTPVYDNIQYERAQHVLLPVSQNGHAKYTLMDKEPEQKMLSAKQNDLLLVNPYPLVLPNIEQPVFRKATYDFGIFLLHEPAKG